MDRIAKGMSEAGRHPGECCTKRESLLRRMAHSLKSAATQAGHVLMGRHGIKSRSAH
jgi:hypothetical protein